LSPKPRHHNAGSPAFFVGAIANSNPPHSINRLDQQIGTAYTEPIRSSQPEPLQEATMISNFIDRWFDELLAWQPCVDILATLPDNY